MTLTEEDILKVFEDSDEEEVSCLDENKDLKFKNQTRPTVLHCQAPYWV